MRWLGTLGGGDDQPWAINDRGVVVGASSLTRGALFPRTAFLWELKRGMIDLGALIGDQVYSAAYDINVQGYVVGESVKGPFLWRDETSNRILPFPSAAYALGINRLGVVVGQYWNASLGKTQSYRWTQLRGFVNLGPSTGDHA